MAYDSSHSSQTSAPAASRAPLLWPAVVILAAGAALIAALEAVDWPFLTTEAHRILAVEAAAALTLFTLGGWLLFASGAQRRTRRIVWLSCLLLLAAAVAALRIDGVSGDILPIVTWRWIPKPDKGLAKELPAGDVSASDAVDLTATTPDDFPQFLGPTRNGQLHGLRLARDWKSQPPRLVWRQPIGAGWSSFAVVGPFAVTQEQRGDQELVTCYELATGKLRWLHGDKGRLSSTMAGDGPRATPTIADGTVYTLGAKGRLNCLDGEGRLLWTHDVLKELRVPNAEWGKSCSPLVVDELVIVSGGAGGGPSLVAFDKRSGEQVWTAGNDGTSYASPLEANLVGGRQILIVNAGSVAGHDPADGRMLWRYQWDGGEPKVPQPVPIGPDRVFIAAGYGLGSNVLELKRAGRKILAEPLWSSFNLSLKPKFTNVVVHDGCVFGLDDGRSLNCLDLESGARKWRGGRYGHGHVLLVDDLLLVQTESGEMVLLEASTQRHHELGRFQAIEGKTWNTPALAGRHLLVRNDQVAACYELPLD